MPFFQRHRPDPDEEEDDFEDDFTDTRGRYLGGVVPLELLVARSDSAAVAVRGLVAYPDGFEFTLKMWVRDPPRLRRGRRLRGPMLFDRMELDEDEELPDEYLRFGIEFPDGARVTNIDEPHWAMSPDATEPAHGMESHSGGGSDTEYAQEYWAWPLPSAGTLSFVCEWPAFSIAETRAEVDAQLVIDAASRATPVWSDLADGVSHVSRAVMFRRTSAARADESDEDS